MDLHDRWINKNQCELTVSEGIVYIRNFGDVMTVNKEPLKEGESRLLHHGDVLGLRINREPHELKLKLFIPDLFFKVRGDRFSVCVVKSGVFEEMDFN